jgi:hypothetical protein
VYEQLRTPVHSATTIRLGHPPFTERYGTMVTPAGDT